MKGVSHHALFGAKRIASANTPLIRLAGLSEFKGIAL